MTTTSNVEILTLDRLASLSGRTEAEILDDVSLGNLKACVLTKPVDGDDHIRRYVIQRADEGERFTVIHSRILWLSRAQASELVANARTTLTDADYPRYVDCLETPPVKRYKKERVRFFEPYTARLSDIRFLDADAAGYISKHTGVARAPKDAVKQLPKLNMGGSFYVGRMIEKGQSESDEVKKMDFPKTVPASEAMQQAILNALVALNIEPLAVPKSKPGLPGARKQVREYLEIEMPFFGYSKFKKAYQALRDSGKIQDA